MSASTFFQADNVASTVGVKWLYKLETYNDPQWRAVLCCTPCIRAHEVSRTLTACASYLCHTGKRFKSSVPQKESRPSALAQTLT